MKYLLDEVQLINYLKAEFEKLNLKIDVLNDRTENLSPPHGRVDLGDWLTEIQTKELLQRGATSLWDLRKRRKLKFTKIGNQIFYSKESIFALLNKNSSR